MSEGNASQWLIYGAYGYTGGLIAEEAAKRGLKPILAGRNRAKVEVLAHNLLLKSRVFDLESVDQIAEKLGDVKLVLNCAGPFDPSADLVVQACIKKGIHYLDISGEPDMFEKHLARNRDAAATGSVIMPGVGFDVVPSDTLAKKLSEKLPGAVNLEMAFFGDGKGSAGSAKTTLGMFADKCKVRRDGKIVRKPLGFLRKQVKFSDREEWCMSIAWGDISTAYHSTGIPNITMYMAMPEKAAKIMRLLSPLSAIFKIPAVRKKMFEKIEAGPQGPDIETRNKTCMRLWGKVSDAMYNSVEATIDTPEGFTFTTDAALLCVKKVLAGEVSGGCYTPTMAFGTGLLDEIPNVEFRWRE